MRRKIDDNCNGAKCIVTERSSRAQLGQLLGRVKIAGTSPRVLGVCDVGEAAPGAGRLEK